MDFTIMLNRFKTKADLEALSTRELLRVYNTLTGRSATKFASRSKGVEQTLRALETRRSEQKGSGRRQVREQDAQRRGAGMSFRLPPRAEQKEPRTGSKRARVLELLRRANGALFSEVQAECGWDEKSTYEGIRLLAVFSGFGLWHEPASSKAREVDYRVRVVNRTEYHKLVEQAAQEG